MRGLAGGARGVERRERRSIVHVSGGWVRRGSRVGSDGWGGGRERGGGRGLRGRVRAGESEMWE